MFRTFQTFSDGQPIEDFPASEFLDLAQTTAVDRIAIDQYGFPGIVLMENAAAGAARLLITSNNVLNGLGIFSKTPVAASSPVRMEGGDELDGREIPGCHLYLPEPPAEGQGQGEPLDLFPVPKVVVMCGSGNNGGDGLAIARHLKAAGWMVSILFLGQPEKCTPDAATHLEIAEKVGIFITKERSEEKIEKFFQCQQLTDSDWIIDAMVGTGSRARLEGPLKFAAKIANNLPAKRFAVDLPSGLPCDHLPMEQQGATSAGDHFFADITCTFVRPKKVMLQPDCRRYTGRIFVQDIGITQEILLKAKSQSSSATAAEV